MQAVTRKEGDNAEFFRATPQGQMEMTISNPVTGQWFHERLGRDLYVDFVEADESPRTSPYGM